MDTTTLLALVPTAIGVALSPAPIVELILVLFSRRRVVNSVAFVLVLLAMTGAALALGALGQQAASGSGGGTSRGTGIVLAVFGALLLLLAWRNWQSRGDRSEPKVFSTISGMGPAAAGFLAFGAVFVNPKNLVLLLAAGQTIGASDTGSTLLLGAAFVLLATLPYTLAAAYALLGGEAANARLDRWRAWLVAHNRLIMAVVLAVLGLVLLAKGVAAL
jgi:uncharacterized protein involved in response to NO